jgi:hypothetical protein
MKSARKQELVSDHFRRLDPVGQSFSRVFSKFKLHRLVRLALNDGHAITDSVVPNKICNVERDQVATAQLAIDCDIEQSQIAKIARKFKACADGPNLFWQQWSLLADEATFVPGSVFWGGCW